MFENDFIVEFNDEELGKCRTYPRNFKGYEQAIKDLKLYKAKQNQRIAELEEQLKNSISPKFKIGDKCWAIRNATNIYNEPKQILIKEITINKNCIKYYAKNGCLTNRTNKTTMHIQSQLFADKEKAKEKLEELKGESE